MVEDMSSSEYVNIRFVILDRDCSRFITDKFGDLPSLQVPYIHYSNCRQISSNAFLELGLPVNQLRTVEGYSVSRTVSCELKPGTEVPSNFRWASIDSLPDDCSILMDHCARDSTPWSYPGWLQEVNSWVEYVLAEKGIKKTGYMIPEKIWSISYVASVPTDRGVYWFKAAPKFFSVESTLTNWLHQNFSHITPSVVSIEKSQNWMLMEDFQGEDFNGISDRNKLSEYLELLGELQSTCSDRSTELETLGLRRNNPRLLIEFIDWLNSWPHDIYIDLDKEQRNLLIGSLPALRNSAEELVNTNIQPTLEHGDMDASNAFVTNRGNVNRPIFMDWSDAVISHPFFTMSSFWGIGADEAFVAKSYLKAFTRFRPMEELLKEYRHSATLSALCRTAYYWEMKPRIPNTIWWELKQFYLDMLRLVHRQSALCLRRGMG